MFASVILPGWQPLPASLAGHNPPPRGAEHLIVLARKQSFLEPIICLLKRNCRQVVDL
jgi:hypothetical protein